MGKLKPNGLESGPRSVILDYDFNEYDPVAWPDRSTDIAWDLAFEANEAEKAWCEFQSRIETEHTHYNRDDGSVLWQEEGYRRSTEAHRTYFEVVSRMAAVVMKHPDCPFSKQSISAWKKETKDRAKAEQEYNSRFPQTRRSELYGD